MVVSPIDSMSGTAYPSVLASLSSLHRSWKGLGHHGTYFFISSISGIYVSIVAWIGVGTVRNSFTGAQNYYIESKWVIPKRRLPSYPFPYTKSDKLFNYSFWSGVARLFL